jgi:hypothetical protein
LGVRGGRSAQSLKRCSRRGGLLALFALAIGVVLPCAAGAHGPVGVVASSYLARVRSAPAGIEAKIIDGDQRMWLRERSSQTVVVLDHQGAPYLRFTSAGVQVNENSPMFYLNETPPQTPPARLTRATAPSWRPTSAGHDYSWHDGRLHALATVARPPGTAYLGAWTIPVLIDGRLSSITGGLWRADRPSIAWFWPIAVVLLCAMAARRVHRRELDVAVSRVLAFGALTGTALAGAGSELYGRPFVSSLQLILLAAIAAFVLSAARGVLSSSALNFWSFLTACAALWAGLEWVPTLRDGFVLVALPAFVARAATVLCLGCGSSLLLMWFRLASYPGGPFSTTEHPEDLLPRDDRFDQAGA